jgi:hypothetical protein
MLQQKQQWRRGLGLMVGGAGLLMGVLPVQALPGQTSDEAIAWMQGNPTISPARGERLVVKKSDTPAQRFTFKASPMQAGRAALGIGSGVIRTEEFVLFDMINGVTLYRLEESLRAIYGPSIYQDYAQGRRVYGYPDRETIARATNRATPLLAAIRGELREGDRYAYWLETVRRPDGFAYSGKLTVLLKEDLPKLEGELRNR